MNLESDKRLNIQLRLDFSSAPTGEARQAGREDIESLSVISEPERPANTCHIMEDACERANLKEALRQVRGNKGSAGIDRMTVDQLGDYLKQHWPAIREQLFRCAPPFGPAILVTHDPISDIGQHFSLQ